MQVLHTAALIHCCCCIFPLCWAISQQPHTCMHADARCFYRLEDWWTYELCYQKHVRQFHREKDVLTSEYLLGVYHQDSADADTLQVASPTCHPCGYKPFRCTLSLSAKYLHICLHSVLKKLSLLLSCRYTVYAPAVVITMSRTAPVCSGQLCSRASAPDMVQYSKTPQSLFAG